MDTNTTTAAIGAASQPNLQTVVNFLCGNGMLLGRWFFDGPPAGERDRFWWRKYLRASFAASTVTASAEALEALEGRISRIGLDIDRALAGEVVEQSPVEGRLKQIAALARAAAPAAQEAEPVGYWVSFTDEPELELGHWFSEEPCGEGYLSLPLYAHPPRPQAGAQEAEPTPIDMVLHCPACGLQHIDAPDERTPGWKNEPHRSHLCHGCGHIWRPADVPTNGVAAVQTKGKADSPIAAQAPRPQADAGAPPAVPDGWRLVPVEPTKAMLRAGSIDLGLGNTTGTLTRAGECYRAMLAAAPQAPAAENGREA